MPRGSKGEKRRADVIGATAMVAQFATGEFIAASLAEMRSLRPLRW